MPSTLETRPGLIHLMTAVIFICSVQHAVVNGGQFDFGSWMPNAPSSMRQPPPKEKGATTLQTILDTLPEVKTSATALTMVWLLSNEPDSKRCLGNYPEGVFIEELQGYIKYFQETLAEISKQIHEREKNWELTYLYLDPKPIAETDPCEPLPRSPLDPQ